MLERLGIPAPRGKLLLELESGSLTLRKMTRLLEVMMHERSTVPEVGGLFLCARKPRALIRQGLLLPTAHPGVYRGKRLQGWPAELWFCAGVPKELPRSPEYAGLRLATAKTPAQRLQLLRELPGAEMQAWLRLQVEAKMRKQLLERMAQEDDGALLERLLKEEREQPGRWTHIFWVQQILQTEQETERRVRQETEHSILQRLWQAVLDQARSLAPELLPELEALQDPERAQRRLFEHLKRRLA